MWDKSFPSKIKNILLGIFEMKVTHAEIAELVKISRIVITSFLINSRSSTVRLCQLHGLTLTDLSYDCIAEIFEKDESGNFRILQNLFTSFHVPLKELPEIEVFFAYKKLLIKIAEVQIANMYSEYDHNGFMIQRNIKGTVQKTGLFLIEKDIYGFKMKLIQDDSLEKRPYLQIDKIEHEFLSQTHSKNTTPELLKILKNIIDNLTEFRKEIKLLDAVLLLKKVYRIDSELNDSNGFEVENLRSNSSLEKYEIDQIAVKVINNVKEKIFIKYFARNKLTREQAEALYLAINDIILDWVEVGKNHSTFFEYLKKHIKINDGEYHQIIRDKMEYLIKEARKEFTAFLLSIE